MLCPKPNHQNPENAESGSTPATQQTSQPASPPSAQPGPTFHYAGFLKRAVALLIDGTILWIMGFLILTIAHPEKGTLLRTIVGNVVIVAYYVYTVGFLVVKGATPGKMVLGMRVVRLNGRPVNV